MRGLRSIRRDQRGTASVEMALMLPMLLALMFTCMEGGLYLFDQHKVIKGVRDGARFAARQSFSNFVCGTSTVPSSVETQIKNVTVYGLVSVSSSDKPRVSTWTVPDTSGQSNTTVTVSCPATSVSTTGIYVVRGNSPVVTVSAKVLYPSLFRTITGLPATLYIGASQQAAVAGV